MASDFNLDEFVRALDRASDEIKREVGVLPVGAAERFVGLLEARYPIGKKHNPEVPHMRDDIRVRTGRNSDPLVPARRVIGPRLGYIWQDGTRERVDHTRKNARRGRMPAADPHFFERTAVQVRTDMLTQAQAILNRSREID